jgi:beta-aspartyl-peptidase (threonine type)
MTGRMLSSIALFVLLLMAVPLKAEPALSPMVAVQRTLDAQVAAWNRGDLEGYMAGYWKSPALTFYAGGTVTTGWQPTLERYRRRYQGEGKEMGQLVFAEIHVELLGPDAALSRGAWHLRFSDGSKRQGLFTVILRKTPEGWRIVHDHSSAE